MTQVEGREIVEVQLLELFLEVNGDIDTQVQVWISITFAVLVASFVAGDRLSRGARLGIAVLYLSAAAALFARYLRAGAYIPYVLDLYRVYEVGAPDGLGVSRTAGVLRLMLFTVGSLVSALSVLYPRLGRLRETSATEPATTEPNATQA